MIIKVGGGLEPLGPIGVYAYVSGQSNNPDQMASTICYNMFVLFMPNNLLKGE